MYKTNFQKVFDQLQEVLPDRWKKVVFFAGYTDGSYTMKFYTDCGDGKFVDCFSQTGADRIRLIRVFMQIDKELSSARKEKNNNWMAFTMTVDSDGNMTTDFDYRDRSDSLIAYEQAWKSRYLR